MEAFGRGGGISLVGLGVALGVGAVQRHVQRPHRHHPAPHLRRSWGCQCQSHRLAGRKAGRQAGRQAGRVAGRCLTIPPKTQTDCAQPAGASLSPDKPSPPHVALSTSITALTHPGQTWEGAMTCGFSSLMGKGRESSWAKVSSGDSVPLVSRMDRTCPGGHPTRV